MAASGSVNGSVSLSYATGSVSAGAYGHFVGGLVGDINSGSVTSSYAIGSVSGGYGSHEIGGLVGTNNGGTVSYSYASGSVSGGPSSYDIGGLTGSNAASGAISYSYATNVVSGGTGSHEIGALVGDNSTGTVTTSYAAGSVTGGIGATTHVGGLIGQGTYSNSFLSSGTSSYQSSSYPGFIFGTDWFIIDGYTRPFLLSEYSHTITNAHQLQLMGLDLGPSANYTLANNIDMSDVTKSSGLWNPATGFVPLGFNPAAPTVPIPFQGTFDGQWHSISNLTIHDPSNNYLGLFSSVTGSILNVGLINSTVIGAPSTSYAGLLAGSNAGTLTNDYATGTLTVGDGGTGGGIGGLVGANSGSVSNSYASVALRISNGGGGSDGFGGLVGTNSGTLLNDYAMSEVTGSAATANLGGLVGINTSSGTISTSYATGGVRGGSSIGGLVGLNAAGGSVSFGYATGGSWDGAPSLPLVGTSSGFVTGTMLNYAASFVSGQYGGFDFGATWYMVGGYTRPFLRSEYGTTVNTAHQLQLVSLNPAANFTLGTDISMAELLSPSGLWSSATGFLPIGFTTTDNNGSATPFTGTFDGLGHTITGLTIRYAPPATIDPDKLALFSYIGPTGTVRNLGLVDASVTSSGQPNAVALLAGWSDGLIANSYVTGTVSGGAGSKWLGGLVGLNNPTAWCINTSGCGYSTLGPSLITDSYAAVTVSADAGSPYLGGLVGYNVGTIANSYATGAVSGAGSSSNIGGLTGENDSTVQNSYATGAVSGGSGSSGVGGLSGYNRGSVSLSYASGSTVGSGEVGGLVGFNDSFGTISISYALGNVSGGGTGYYDIGGLVGLNYGSINMAYASGVVTGAYGTYNVGGLVGNNTNIDGSGGAISNSYASGAINSTGGGTVGALVGLNQKSSAVQPVVSGNATITSSYANGAVNGNSTNPLAVGVDATSANPGSWSATYTPFTQATYTTAGFLFATTPTDTNPWYMITGSTRPFLRIEYSTTITNAHQLQMMSLDPTASYTLANDISMSELAQASGAWSINGFVPVGPSFTGIFDGRGHTIANLTINNPSASYLGLFNTIGTTGVVENVGLLESNLTGLSHVGTIAGRSAGNISHVYATGSAYAVSGGGSVGGLVGDTTSSCTISDSYATAAVGGHDAVGGLVGMNGGWVINSFATGSVNGIGAGVASVGGLIGYNDTAALIGYSYATGPVTIASGTNAGGLVGKNASGTINLSYSTGSIIDQSNTYSSVGLLVGLNDAGSSIANSFASGSIAGTPVLASSSVAGGGAGGIDSYSKVLTATDSFLSAKYTGFNIGTSNTWYMIGGNTRPMLQSEYSTTITNAHQLQLMALDPTASYKLGNNISMAETTQTSGVWNAATGFVPVGSSTTPFTGSLNGQSHTISSLFIGGSAAYTGLFGEIGAVGSVHDLSLTGLSVTGGTQTGGLAGKNLGTITNASVIGGVTGASNVGGLTGVNDGWISSSYLGMTSTVQGSASSVGGLVGVNEAGWIANSYSLGAVSTTAGIIGGLVGQNAASIVNSYASGAVTVPGGDTTFGGLVGNSLAGASVVASYWNSGATGLGTSNGGQALSDTQTRQHTSFAGWDYNTIWVIDELSNAYPRLRQGADVTNTLYLTWSVANATSTYGFTPTPGLMTLYGALPGDSVLGSLSVLSGSTPITPTSSTSPGTYSETVSGFTSQYSPFGSTYYLASSGNAPGTLTINSASSPPLPPPTPSPGPSPSPSPGLSPSPSPGPSPTPSQISNPCASASPPNSCHPAVIVLDQHLTNQTLNPQVPGQLVDQTGPLPDLGQKTGGLGQAAPGQSQQQQPANDLQTGETVQLGNGQPQQEPLLMVGSVPVLTTPVAPTLTQLAQTPQVQQGVQTVTTALTVAISGGGNVHDTLVSLNTGATKLTMQEQKAVFASVPTPKLVGGLLASSNPLDKTVGAQLKQVSSGNVRMTFGDVKAVLARSGVNGATALTYLAMYQVVHKEAMTNLFQGALKELATNPRIADVASISASTPSRGRRPCSWLQGNSIQRSLLANRPAQGLYWERPLWPNGGSG